MHVRGQLYPVMLLSLIFLSLLCSACTAAERWEFRRDPLVRICPIWSIVSVEGTHNEIGFKIVKLYPRPTGWGFYIADLPPSRL